MGAGDAAGTQNLQAVVPGLEMDGKKHGGLVCRGLEKVSPRRVAWLVGSGLGKIVEIQAAHGG